MQTGPLAAYQGVSGRVRGRRQDHSPVLEDRYRDVLLEPELGERVGAALDGDFPIADLFRRVGV